MSDKHPKNNKIVVDGANIAWAEKSNQGNPKVENILTVKTALEHKGYDPEVIVDASLYHEIDDPDQLDQLLDEGRIKQAPAGTDADYFVVETAARYHCPIVSNDQYQPYLKKHPWITDDKVEVMIINGRAEFYHLPDA